MESHREKSLRKCRPNGSFREKLIVVVLILSSKRLDLETIVVRMLLHAKHQKKVAALRT